MGKNWRQNLKNYKIDAKIQNICIKYRLCHAPKTANISHCAFFWRSAIASFFISVLCFGKLFLLRIVDFNPLLVALCFTATIMCLFCNFPFKFPGKKIFYSFHWVVATVHFSSPWDEVINLWSISPVMNCRSVSYYRSNFDKY